MNEENFRARLYAGANDRAALTELNAQLDKIEAPWKRAMQFRLAAARVRLRAPREQVASPIGVAVAPEWLSQFGLPNPDGRPLYRYRIGQVAFEALGNHLKKRALTMRFQALDADAALFVIWAAEWFRRSYAGGGEEWARLGAGIDLKCEQAQWRALTDRGLRFWRIPPLRLNNTHHRLVALARQAGFPLAALGDGTSDGARGWAARYLGRLVGLLLNEPFVDEANALAHAQGLSELIPETWANPGMIQVCAELAGGVVRLRREAEAAGVADGTLAVAWLDLHQPDWRSTLPVALDDSTAQRLLGELMRTRAIRGGGTAIAVRRVLSFADGKRREQVELLLVGSLASDDPRQLRNLGQDWSRLRLFPAGLFAQHVGGELGVAAAGDEGEWSVRPSSRRAVFDVPFSVPVEVELRGDGKRVAGPFAMPHGGAIRGGLLLLREDGDRFIVEGAGSGSYRAEEVHIEAPTDWRIEIVKSGEATRVDEHVGRCLTRVSGSIHVHTPDDDIYFIRTGQAADRRDRIIVIGKAPSSCQALDDLPLISGTPELLVSSDALLRAAGGEGWWRPRGERHWYPAARPIVAGPTEFAWRDATTGCIRARASAFVLPTGFSVEHSVMADSIELSISGWPGSIESSMGLAVGPGRWRVPVIPRDRTPAIIELGMQGRPAAKIVATLSQRAWIHEWSEGPASRDSVISLALLHRYVARCDGRIDLMADLIDRDGRLLGQGQAIWSVDGELALATIRDDIAAMLRPLGDIRARVRLDYNDGYNNHWYIAEFDHDLQLELGGYVPTRAIADIGVRIAGRSLSDPAAKPSDFGAYSLIDYRPIQIPQVQGDWLVYLRSDDRVLSCPQFHRGTPLSAPPSSLLGKAMAIGDRCGRLDALSLLCDEIVAEPLAMRSTLREIIDLSLTLDGLPPATFDILGLIPERLEIGALMLFVARDSEVETIMRLSNGLPFSWSLIPHSIWNKAAQSQAEAMFAATPDAAAFVGQEIGLRRQRIAEFDPALRPLLELPSKTQPLRDAANSFLNRSYDRIREAAQSPFRPEYENVLPTWEVSAVFWRALDAPVVAARAAQGRVALNPELVRCAKDVARTHPVWFAQGFAAALEED